jgi:hypothetical protein
MATFKNHTVLCNELIDWAVQEAIPGTFALNDLLGAGTRYARWLGTSPHRGAFELGLIERKRVFRSSDFVWTQSNQGCAACRRGNRLFLKAKLLAHASNSVFVCLTMR